MTVLQSKSLFRKVLSGSLLIAGTTIGAGMLGIPLVTWQSGFMPAVLITSVVWLFMLATGYLLTLTTLKLPLGSSFSSLAEYLLGKKSKWLIALLFLFLYYSLMVAYFAAGAPFFGLFIEKLGFGNSALFQNLSFALFFGFIVAKGSHSIDRANIVLTLLMFVCYALLINTGFVAVKKELLASYQFSHIWIACPILFSAFGFHNVIPSLTTYLNKDKKALWLSLLIGTFIPFAIYLLWQWLVLGAVPPDALQKTLKEGKPATYALAAVTAHPYIFPIGQTFAFFAIVTSLLGVSFSLVDFIKDSLKTKTISYNRKFLAFLTFFPPFVFATLNPGIFDEALGIAGGIGEALLNGIVPTLLFMSAEKRWPQFFPKTLILQKPFLILLLLIATGVMGIEIIALLY